MKKRAQEDKLGEITDSRVKEMLEKARQMMLPTDLEKFKVYEINYLGIKQHSEADLVIKTATRWRV